MSTCRFASLVRYLHPSDEELRLLAPPPLRYKMNEPLTPSSTTFSNSVPRQTTGAPILSGTDTHTLSDYMLRHPSDYTCAAPQVQTPFSCPTTCAVPPSDYLRPVPQVLTITPSPTTCSFPLQTTSPPLRYYTTAVNWGISFMTLCNNSL